MKTTKNRASDFPPKGEANFEIKKVGKRTAYILAYCLLTFAYRLAYSPAYLQVTGWAQRSSVAPTRLVLWVENSACPRVSCGFF